MNKRKNRLDTVRNMSSSLLEEGTTIRIRAHGYSMYPSIKPGSLLIIEPLRSKGDPVKGEIVAIKRESGLIVHRITEINIHDGKRYYTARGDSSGFADKPVPISLITGRVVRSEPTGENPVAANIRINKSPSYFLNRIRVIFILIRKRLFS
jgi:signal peptidase I